MRTETPGRLFALALSLKELWPTGPSMPSAFPKTVFSGLYTFKVSSTCYLFAPRLLSCLRINQRVTTPTARLDSRPVASGYLGRIRSCKMPRHCQAAANG